MTDDDKPPYSLKETISEIRAYNRGRRISQIEVAISALYWLERAPDMDGVYPATLKETVGALASWLGNDDERLPDMLIDAAFHWLRMAKRSA